METVRTAGELRDARGRWEMRQRTVAFVPTMGALHEGHLSLVRLARQRAERVVASIFVNPTQFNNPDDLARYPRTPENDAAMLEYAGCDLLFLPAVEEIYPPGSVTRVDVAGPPAEGFEGDFRPGHFRGVATVVTTLFHLVRPDVAIFGEKDAQQLAVVQRLVKDLGLPIEIVPGPTLRETDGLAMSSRNVHLSVEERRAATVLFRALSAANAAMDAGERRGDEIARLMRSVLSTEPLAEVEYASAVDALSFTPLATLTGSVVLPLAVRIGKTRLIDNFRLQLFA